MTEEKVKKPSTKKSVVPDDVRMEEARLGAIVFRDAKHNTTHPLSQKEFGKKYEIGGQAAVQQMLNGLRPMNLPFALKLSAYAGVPINKFSPRLQAELDKLVAAASSSNSPFSDLVSRMTPERADMWRKFDALTKPVQDEIIRMVDTHYKSHLEILKAMAPQASVDKFVAYSSQNQPIRHEG